MKMRTINLCIAVLAFTTSFGQEKWDLRKAVDYATSNNISVKQADLQSQFSELALKQNKSGRLPSLNFNGNTGLSFGRSENQARGVYEYSNLLNIGMQMQSQVTLFNWFSLKNTVEASRLTWEADKEQTRKVQNDISLNVAVAYLQILLSREQVKIAAVQVEQTKAQLDITRRKVTGGSLPELNAAELEAQLARDSSLLVTSEGAAQQYLLQMKALLNLDAATDFDVQVPPVEIIPVEPLAEMQPEAVYASAIANLPQQRVNDLRLKSAERSVAAARGNLYPTISAYGGLYTTATSYKKIPVYEQIVTGYSPSSLRAVGPGGVYYPVQIPDTKYTNNIVDYGIAPSIGSQFNNNFGQNIGIGLNIPILNGRQARTGWDRSKLQVKQLELTKQQDNLTLKQDIYTAYNDAVTAMQKFNANRKTVETSQKAYDFARKRYDVALLSTLELITSQNNLQRAKIDMLYSQYDYIFKMKLLEFYKGQGIKLE